MINEAPIYPVWLLIMFYIGLAIGIVGVLTGVVMSYFFDHTYLATIYYITGIAWGFVSISLWFGGKILKDKGK